MNNITKKHTGIKISGIHGSHKATLPIPSFH